MQVVLAPLGKPAGISHMKVEPDYRADRGDAAGERTDAAKLVRICTRCHCRSGPCRADHACERAGERMFVERRTATRGSLLRGDLSP